MTERNLQNILLAALQWHIDAGADEALADEPVIARAAAEPIQSYSAPVQAQAFAPMPQVKVSTSTNPARNLPVEPQAANGTFEAVQQATDLARSAQNLDELRAALAGFEGLSIRKTATNMVFCDGNPQAPVMIVGEAPGADEDKQGKPFVGVSGQLLDRILACIDLSRTADDPARAVYISNILNWRPPGNRTPSDSEVAISLPFIERHIVLVRPRLIVLAGGVAAKALLNTDQSISRLRGRWHKFEPQTAGIADNVSHISGNGGDLSAGIPIIATYHPAYLLRTPTQKQAVWSDMLILQEKMREMGIKPRA